MRETNKSNLSPLALLRMVAEDYVDFYGLDARGASRTAKTPKLPADEIAEIVGEPLEAPAESEANPVIDISSHPDFDASRLGIRLRRPAPAHEPETDRALPA